MIPVQELLYGIDQRLNKLGTNTHQYIPDEDKLLLLNEAQLTLIKQKVDGNNIYKLGLDGFKKRYQDLEKFIEPFSDHAITLQEKDTYLNKWVADLSQLNPKLLFYIDSYLVASKDGCKNRVIACNANPVKHQDIQLLLKDSNHKPSFEYQETLISISSNLLEVYTDGEWITDKLYLSYLRYPKQMSIEGGENLDGSPTTLQDCELEYYLKDELLDIVLLSLGIYTENPNAVQGAQIKAQNSE